ncbi:hypothetical protein BpHYR1_041789 [Brachionus plicatilis]|uniref:Uncharacterized protein n=1 Tax=Brachionus plicatilis TaxID=10195 RepID=A0A3M7QGZ7_BRAPC|nr:hypothetical protein BpHYR1_041789 [Brachionus plicatilis]
MATNYTEYMLFPIFFTSCKPIGKILLYYKNLNIRLHIKKLTIIFGKKLNKLKCITNTQSNKKNKKPSGNFPKSGIMNTI